MKNKSRIGQAIAEGSVWKCPDCKKEFRNRLKWDAHMSDPNVHTPKAQQSTSNKDQLLSKYWRVFTDMVSNTYPDGDPIDALFSKYRDFDMDKLEAAAQKNGYSHPMDYWEELDSQISKDREAERVKEGEQLEEATFTANLSDDDYRTIRKASMYGKFPHDFSMKTNGDITFRTQYPNQLVKDLEKLIDSGETSWSDILDIYGVQRDAKKSDGTPVAYAGGGAFTEKEEITRKKSRITDSVQSVDESKALKFNDKRDKKIAQFVKAPNVFVIAKKNKHGYGMFVWDEASGKAEVIARMIAPNDFDLILNRKWNQEKFKKAGGIKKLAGESTINDPVYKEGAKKLRGKKEVNEISKDLAKRYLKKADKSLDKLYTKHSDSEDRANDSYFDGKHKQADKHFANAKKLNKKIDNREDGIGRAEKRLSKESRNPLKKLARVGHKADYIIFNDGQFEIWHHKKGSTDPISDVDPRGTTYADKTDNPKKLIHYVKSAFGKDASVNIENWDNDPNDPVYKAGIKALKAAGFSPTGKDIEHDSINESVAVELGMLILSLMAGFAGVVLYYDRGNILANLAKKREYKTIIKKIDAAAKKDEELRNLLNSPKLMKSSAYARGMRPKVKQLLAKHLTDTDERILNHLADIIRDETYRKIEKQKHDEWLKQQKLDKKQQKINKNIKKKTSDVFKEGTDSEPRSVKEAEQVHEGMWAFPDTEEKVERLLMMMTQPIIKDAEEGESQTMNKLYSLLGDDDLFDEFHDAEVGDDLRPIIKSFLFQTAKKYGEVLPTATIIAKRLSNQTSETSLDENQSDVTDIIMKTGGFARLGAYADGTEEFLGSPMHDALYDYYANSGEMPYGAVTGDTDTSDQWILTQLEQEGILDQIDMGQQMAQFEELRKLAGLTESTEERYTYTKTVVDGESTVNVTASSKSSSELDQILNLAGIAPAKTTDCGCSEPEVIDVTTQQEPVDQFAAAIRDRLQNKIDQHYGRT